MRRLSHAAFVIPYLSVFVPEIILAERWLPSKKLFLKSVL